MDEGIICCNMEHVRMHNIVRKRFDPSTLCIRGAARVLIIVTSAYFLCSTSGHCVQLQATQQVVQQICRLQHPVHTIIMPP